MKKNILILMIVFVVLLSSLVSAISKYYSPIVTGQGITDELLLVINPLIFDNLILGTPMLTIHKTTFNTCVFAGSGDGDYRYANVDEDGLIYLTDDDFINVFDDDCTLIATHTLNGTLNSQPYIFDVEGNGFQNIFYIATDLNGISTHLNTIELVNGIFTLQDSAELILARRCVGLYCDRNGETCGTICGTGSACDILVIEGLSLFEIINTSIASGSLSTCQFNSYDETSDFGETGNIGVEYYDRTIYGMYGMDINTDGDIDFVSWGQSIATQFIVDTVDLTDKTLISSNNLIIDITAGTDTWYSSGGLIQTANYGTLTSNGEVFFAGVGFPDTSSIDGMMIAEVFNSELSLIKSIIKYQGIGQSRKISNFAVALVDGDDKNDYCIAFNNTQHNNNTVIECYSGLTNSIMVNCTISGWESNNPIHLTLGGWDVSSIRLNAITTFGIFDLNENSGGECDNLRGDGFTGLTSASEGVMLPVDVSGDGNFDLVYYGADGARLFKTEAITGEGPQSAELCGAEHIIFCDDFNYDFSLFQRGWEVLEQDGEINTSVTPRNNKLNATDVKFQSFVHDLPSVDVNYTISGIGEERRIILSFVHPVVSHLFKLNIVNDNGLIEFRVDDRDLQPSVQLRFRGGDISYVNVSGAETIIASNYLTPNATHTMKVTQFFGNDNAKEQGEPYPFNISVDKGFYKLFVDNELISQNITFANNASYDASTWLFTKNKNTVTGFIMDDVFTYRGTSQFIDNSNNFFTDIIEDIIFECQIEGLFCAMGSDECCDGLACVNNECVGTDSVLVDDVDNNALRDAIEPLAEASNMSIGTWWLMIMVAVGMAVFVGANIILMRIGAQSFLLSFIVFSIVEFLLLIIGARLGMISAGIIISITVVALVIIAVFVIKWVTGVSANG